MTYEQIQRFVQRLPGLYLVVQADPQFTIVAASDEYLRATRMNVAILGQAMFTVFPDNPATPDAKAAHDLRASFERVLATRATDTMATQSYDVPLSSAAGGGFEEGFWKPVNAPVLSASGDVEYILHRVEQLQPDRERLVAESETQRRIYETALNSTPDFVYVFGLDHRALYANEALLKVWGVSDVRGKRWTDLGYEQWHADMHDAEIDRVIRTGAPIRGEIPFTGTNGTRVYDYIFAPVLGSDGQVVAIAGTTRDVTDRQAAEQALRQHAATLAEADRAKDEFLATLSHELRNPLAPLRNSLALLRGIDEGNSKTEPVRAIMERQVNHLVRLVDDLLEVSRISRGTLSLRKERVEMAAIVQSAIETSEPLISAAGQALEVRLPHEPLWLEGDPVRLAQVLANLLNNAAKYSEVGGRVTVRVDSQDGHAVIKVRDDGIGIDPETLPRMFEMFSRGHGDSGRAQGGLGIGLALSRRLAELHGGRLDGYSEGVGKGSEFVVHLPLPAALAATQAPPPADAQAAALHGIAALVVDDNPDSRESMGQVLTLLGANVRVAGDGSEALEAFAAFRPRVVLLDIGMPGMNGYEVARTIRERFPGTPTTLVALTGWGQDGDRHRAREAGFDHHLVKPAEIDALQALLGSLNSATQ